MNKNLRVVISGAQGSGKTTLAEALSKKFNIPLSDSKTQHYYPEGMNSHLDILKAALIDPEVGINFQKKLMQGRSKEFANLSSFVSDRGLIDSLVYFLIHNSMYATNDDYIDLLKLTYESFDNIDINIVMSMSNESLIKKYESGELSVADNGVRVVNIGYYDLVSTSIEQYTHNVINPDNCHKMWYGSGDHMMVMRDVMTGKVFIFLEVDHTNPEHSTDNIVARISEFLTVHGDKL